MMCDQCAVERGLAEGEPGTFPSPVKAVGTVEGVQVGCFPDLYSSLFKSTSSLSDVAASAVSGMR